MRVFYTIVEPDRRSEKRNEEREKERAKRNKSEKA